MIVMGIVIEHEGGKVKKISVNGGGQPISRNQTLQAHREAALYWKRVRSLVGPNRGTIRTRVYWAHPGKKILEDKKMKNVIFGVLFSVCFFLVGCSNGSSFASLRNDAACEYRQCMGMECPAITHEEEIRILCESHVELMHNPRFADFYAGQYQALQAFDDCMAERMDCSNSLTDCGHEFAEMELLNRMENEEISNEINNLVDACIDENL